MIELQYTLDDGTSDIVLGTVPDGWADFEFIFQRSKDLQSVSKNYSESVLRFQNRPYGLFNPNTEQYNPFLFIKRAYDMDGTDAEINLKIHLRNHLTGAYDLLMLDAQLNWNDDPSFDKDYFELTVVENSVMAKYIARDDVLINPNSGKNLDGNAITALVPDDIRIFKEDLVLNSVSDVDANVPLNTSTSTLIYPVLTKKIDQIGEYLTPTAQTLVVNDTSQIANVYLYGDVDYSLDYTLDSSPLDETTLRIDLKIDLVTYDSGANELARENIVSRADTAFREVKNETFDDNVLINKTIPLNVGDEIRYEIFIESQIGPEANSTYVGSLEDAPSDKFLESTDFIIRFISTPETDERAAFSYFPYPLASKLLESATGNGTLEAPIFQRTEDGALGDGEYSLTSVLSGYMSRGFPITEQPQAFKLKDLISAFFGVKNTGIWFDGTKWIWDKLERFYQDVEILDVGEVSEFKTTAASDYYYNEVIGGAANKVELGDLNGLEDSGTKTNWTTPIKHIKGKYDITSDYEISGNIIEITSRKTYETTAAEDTKYDKNTCLLQCRRDETGLRSDDGTDFSLIENVFDPENKKNLKITSARNAYNHIQEIASVYWKKTNAELSFADAQINSDMRTRIGVDDPIIQENGDIPQSDLGNPLWIPEVITGKCGGIGYEELAKLKANPHGFITGTDNGERFFGFILEFPVNIKEGIANFKLLKKYGGYPPTNIYSTTYSNKYD